MIKEGKGDSRIKTLFMAITRNPREMTGQLQLASKLMQRRFGRLPFVAKFSLVLTLCLSVVIYGSVFYVIFGNRLKSEDFLEVAKCPGCYGISACERSTRGEVSFVGWSKIRLLDYVNVDNVYHGTHGREESVVISKLGSNARIAAMDRELCALAKEPEDCDVGGAASKAFPPSGTKWMVKQMTGMSDMTTCPTERLLETIMSKYIEKHDAISLSAAERTQLLTTLMINQGPILFQTFPKQDGWPFPKYIGSCGRFVMTEYAGRPLYDFYGMPFKIRAKFALRLLSIARQLTDDRSQFALYWTRLSYASFAVDEAGDVVVVDGQNVLVVDRWQIKHDKTPGWDEPCYSVFDSCADAEQPCQLTVPDRLCSAHTADHNYYALCRNILSTYAMNNDSPISLLHNIPPDIEELYHIRQLADRCAHPEKPGQRAEVVEELVKVLTEVIGPQLTKL